MSTETAATRLTALSRGGGCATKIAQADLLPLVGGLGIGITGGRLLAGAGDDAAVWRLSDDLALVLTTDFFAPVVDDPDDYGTIAAVNALSDVWAMGGDPLLALNIVAWPGEDVLPPTVLATVLGAMASAVAAAGARTVGGHSVRDAEPKVGLAVVGTVHPHRVMTTAGGRPGDRLLLTKPLGTGIVANGLRREVVPGTVLASAVASMRTPNATSAACAVDHGVRCATDVSGFGLLGHAWTIATGSACTVELTLPALPLLPGALDLARAGVAPGGSRRALAFAAEFTAWGPGTEDDALRLLAADAQTSGGLLLAVDAAVADALLGVLAGAGVAAAEVGRLTERGDHPLRVVAA